MSYFITVEGVLFSLYFALFSVLAWRAIKEL